MSRWRQPGELCEEYGMELPRAPEQPAQGRRAPAQPVERRPAGAVRAPEGRPVRAPPAPARAAAPAPARAAAPAPARAAAPAPGEERREGAPPVRRAAHGRQRLLDALRGPASREQPRRAPPARRA